VTYYKIKKTKGHKAIDQREMCVLVERSKLYQESKEVT